MWCGSAVERRPVDTQPYCTETASTPVAPLSVSNQRSSSQGDKKQAQAALLGSGEKERAETRKKERAGEREKERRCRFASAPLRPKMCAKVRRRLGALSSRTWRTCAGSPSVPCSGSWRICPGSRSASWRSWRESSSPFVIAPGRWRVKFSGCRDTSQCSRANPLQKVRSRPCLHFTHHSALFTGPSLLLRQVVLQQMVKK